jgi:hypothetical protein
MRAHLDAPPSTKSTVSALLWATLAGALLVPSAGHAQNGPLPTVPSGSVEGTIRIDGRLDEASWGASVPLSEFRMVEPNEGAPATFTTRVRILADPTALYIGIEAFDDDPDGIVSYSKARDAQLRSEDHIKILLDPFLDGQSGFVFAVNPAGARYDALVADQGLGENASWDAVWEARTTVTDSGWTAELRIPIQSLTFSSGAETWGFNVERRVQRLLEVSRWASPSRLAPLTQTRRAGQITDLPTFDSGWGLTVRPAVTAGVEKVDPETPWARDADPSLDVFQRLGSNTTAVLTVNTDFAETEVDTRRTNLTRFPLFFPEKRSFFLDGADIFDFGAGMETFHRQDIIPFFTRRIGLVEGQEVPIRAGGKVSGRAGRTGFGGLATSTDAVDGLVPITEMGAFRVRRNVLDQSSVGGIATFGDPLGRAGSYMAGLDALYNTSQFRGDRNLILGAWGLMTDRDGLTGDRTAVGAIIDYPNDVWDLWLSYKRIGDGFDPSLGFVPRKGVHLANAGANYRWWSPHPRIFNLWFELVPILAWNLAGDLESYRIFTAPLNVRFESGDRIEFNVQPQGERLPEDFEIVDGVVIPEGSYDWVRYRLEVDFAQKRLISGRISAWFGPFYDGHVTEFSARIGINPSDLLNFELSGTRNQGTLPGGEVLQEVASARVQVNFSPDLQWSFLGQYDREENEFGVNSRVRWTFHPLGDLFLIYNNTAFDEIDGGWTTQTSQFLLKVQYAWRR